MATRKRRGRLGKRSTRDAWLEALGKKRGKQYKALYDELVALRSTNPQAYRKRILRLAEELKL